MYTLIRHVGIRGALAAEAAPLFAALLAAELLYKLHSFTLECAAFVATWYALSYLLSLARGARPAREGV